ncbi:hypothetical protein ASF73_17310 [Xanthomonas sp. Leaf131]|nr:hypothetical protein ASF73_17310 [Xanthomonas sp. Leaf131]
MSLVEELARGPRAFLSRHVVVVDEEGVISHAGFREWRQKGCQTDLEGRTTFPPAGVYRFTLVHAFNNVVLLRPDDGRSGAGMRAHWLPWRSGAATSADIDSSAAPLFFTSELTGCRLTKLQDPQDPRKAKVAHLAGNMPRGVVDRNQAEKTLFPGEKKNTVDSRARRMSMSGGTPYTNSTSSFVIGYATPSGWKFVAQVVTGQMTGSDIDLDKSVPIVVPMAQVLDGI